MVTGDDGAATLLMPFICISFIQIYFLTFSFTFSLGWINCDNLYAPRGCHDFHSGYLRDSSSFQMWK